MSWNFWIGHLVTQVGIGKSPRSTKWLTIQWECLPLLISPPKLQRTENGTTLRPFTGVLVLPILIIACVSFFLLQHDTPFSRGQGEATTWSYGHSKMGDLKLLHPRFKEVGIWAQSIVDAKRCWYQVELVPGGAPQNCWSDSPNPNGLRQLCPHWILHWPCGQVQCHYYILIANTTINL